MEIDLIYSKFLETTGVCTDTRKILPGCMFFALKGPNFNANSMAAAALNSGAKYAVIDDEKYKEGDSYILTEDVLATLQHLANFHRKKLGIPILAITGSNGKTTTKELIHAALKTKFKTYATLGNLNNHIGVPLTLLAMDKQVEIGIVEMGANHQKEIESYCMIAEPTHGLITNIGKAHLEGFGGIEGVKKGKGELYTYLTAKGGIIFKNSNDETLKTIPSGGNAITYPKADDFLQCTLLEEVPFVVFKGENQKTYTTHLTGKYNFENIAAALCIAKFFGVPDDQANEAIALYDPQNNRSQIITKGSNTILLDAYNANPSSMKAAIENFAKLSSNNKILILGDMFELGNESSKEHEELGSFLKGLNFGNILFCGKEMANAKKTYPQAEYFENRALLEAWLKKNPIGKSNILIKGSRGMGLEKIVDYI